MEQELKLQLETLEVKMDIVLLTQGHLLMALATLLKDSGRVDQAEICMMQSKTIHDLLAKEPAADAQAGK